MRLSPEQKRAILALVVLLLVLLPIAQMAAVAPVANDVPSARMVIVVPPEPPTEYPYSPGNQTLQPPDKDSYIFGPNNTWDDVNFDTTNEELRVRSTASTNQNRIVLQFDISSLGLSPGDVTSATLSLYYYQYYDVSPYGNPSGKTITAYRLTRTDWPEDEVTWNEYKSGSAWTAEGGDYTTTNSDSTAFPASPNAWMNWDVADMVNDSIEVANGNVSIILRTAASLSPQVLAWFYSAEYTGDTSKRPKLYIEIDTSRPSVTLMQGEVHSPTIARLGGTVTGAGDDETVDVRGFVWDTYSKSTPGNVTPAASDYAYSGNETGTFSVGDPRGRYWYTITGLTRGQTIYFRAFAHNSHGYRYSSVEYSLTPQFSAPYVDLTDLGVSFTAAQAGFPAEKGFEDTAVVYVNNDYHDAYFMFLDKYAGNEDLYAVENPLPSFPNANNTYHGKVLDIDQGRVRGAIYDPSRDEVVVYWYSASGMTAYYTPSDENFPTGNWTSAGIIYSGVFKQVFYEDGVYKAEALGKWATSIDPRGNFTAQSAWTNYDLDPDGDTSGETPRSALRVTSGEEDGYILGFEADGNEWVSDGVWLYRQGNVTSDGTAEIDDMYYADKPKDIANPDTLLTVGNTTYWYLQKAPTGTFGSPQDEQRVVTLDIYWQDITSEPDFYEFGNVTLGKTAETGLTASTIKSWKQDTVTVKIKAVSMTGGGKTWTLGSEAGNMTYALKVGLDDGDAQYDVAVGTTDTTFVTDMSGNSTQDWGLRFYAPTVNTSNSVMSGTVTLTAQVSDYDQIIEETFAIYAASPVGKAAGLRHNVPVSPDSMMF